MPGGRNRHAPMRQWNGNERHILRNISSNLTRQWTLANVSYHWNGYQITTNDFDSRSIIRSENQKISPLIHSQSSKGTRSSYESKSGTKIYIIHPMNWIRKNSTISSYSNLSSQTYPPNLIRTGIGPLCPISGGAIMAQALLAVHSAACASFPSPGWRGLRVSVTVYTTRHKPNTLAARFLFTGPRRPATWRRVPQN